MRAIQDHQPHLMRPWHNEWCGGTEPPTLLTFNADSGEVNIDVFPTLTNLHDGIIHTPVRKEWSLIDTTAEEVTTLLPDRVARYALQAAQVQVTYTHEII